MIIQHHRPPPWQQHPSSSHSSTPPPPSPGSSAVSSTLTSSQWQYGFLLYGFLSRDLISEVKNDLEARLYVFWTSILLHSNKLKISYYVTTYLLIGICTAVCTAYILQFTYVSLTCSMLSTKFSVSQSTSASVMLVSLWADLGQGSQPAWMYKALGRAR